MRRSQNSCKQPEMRWHYEKFNNGRGERLRLEHFGAVRTLVEEKLSERRFNFICRRHFRLHSRQISSWGGVCLIENFPDEMKAGIPNNTRWKIFADFLEIHGDNYEQVFITDTRYVVFQGDVFEKFKDYRNWLGYVTEADDIRGSKLGNRCNYE